MNSVNMIGKIYNAKNFPFFDKDKGKMSYGNRPVLVIGIADTGDCNILPLSRVNEKENVNEDFDIKLNPADFPKLKLKYESYVRVHKQNVIHSGNFDLYVGDMANDYPEKYHDIMTALKDYNHKMISAAMNLG